MRDIIMGYKHIRDLPKYELSPIKERVSNQNQNMIGETKQARKSEAVKNTNDRVKRVPTYASIVSGK